MIFFKSSLGAKLINVSSFTSYQNRNIFNYCDFSPVGFDAVNGKDSPPYIIAPNSGSPWIYTRPIDIYFEKYIFIIEIDSESIIPNVSGITLKHDKKIDPSIDMIKIGNNIWFALMPTLKYYECSIHHKTGDNFYFSYDTIQLYIHPLPLYKN